jgi:hypothetical protein
MLREAAAPRPTNSRPYVGRTTIVAVSNLLFLSLRGRDVNQTTSGL